MESQALLELLRRVASGEIAPEEAASRASSARYVDLGYAKVDLDRPRRVGAPEFVYCANKTIEQIINIVRVIDEAGQNILCTRVPAEIATQIRRQVKGLQHNERARALFKVNQQCMPGGRVAVVSAGTSDLEVAEEAAITAEIMGAKVVRVSDVGVAGLHRLLDHAEMLRGMEAIVAVAGMEGALPSVLAGLIEAPVVAVPTSVGYGVNFNGLAPLLTMLNSCAPGVSVVNIDNGFGAGYQAAVIARSRAGVAKASECPGPDLADSPTAEQEKRTEPDMEALSPAGTAIE